MTSALSATVVTRALGQTGSAGAGLALPDAAAFEGFAVELLPLLGDLAVLLAAVACWVIALLADLR